MISEADALAAHKAIHGGKDTVTLSDGSTLPVEKAKNGCRSVKFPKFAAMEQNIKKSSPWSTKAKEGAKITWFLSGFSPSSWGRIVNGKLESRGKAILDAKEAATAKAKAKAKAAPKAEAASASVPKAKAKAKAAPEAKAASTSGAKAKASPKKRESPEDAASMPEAKKPRKSPAEAAPSTSTSSDPLCLAPLFDGMGHGKTWERVIRPVLESLPSGADFIGPSRDKTIIPVRELTFQALKPNPPSGWRVVSFGQSPFPRMESATGIAHFDNAIKDWDSGEFGSTVTMRCIIKAAAMQKFGIKKETKMPDLRKLLKSEGIIGPAEWFQAMLAQGVLFMNAACTIKRHEKGGRAGEIVHEHMKFWHPVLEAVVNAILEDCAKSKRAVVFAWWGSESLKTKRALDKTCFSKFPSAKVQHIEHYNPAAMGDAFCDDPNIFKEINKAIVKNGLGKEIDWLPTAGTKYARSDEMGAFVAETQELHKMYLERLKDGLDTRGDDLMDIVGVMSKPLEKLADCCKPLKLEKAANASTAQAKSMSRKGLTVEEAGALHLYTTNFLYKALNEALRDKDRKKATQYFLYLRLFLEGLQKLPTSKRQLYRGVALDLSSQYKQGSVVTWWAVSSCTPDRKVASSFSGSSKSTLFIIDSIRSVGIRDFSQYKSEEEYILAPGTEFEVVKVQKKGSSVEVHMKELDRKRRVH